MRFVYSVLAYSVLALVVTVPLAARADPGPPAAFAWYAPPECPDREATRSTVERWLRQSSEPVDARSLAVTARIEREGERYRLALVLESPGGVSQDVLVAGSCDTLVEVVALKIAFAASSTAAIQKLDPTPQPAPPPLHLGLRLSAGAAVGRLPNPGVEFALAGVLAYSFARLELLATYALPSAARYLRYPDVGANLQLATGTLRVCAAAQLGAAQVPICAGFALGLMHGVGFGVKERDEVSLLLADVLFAPALRWPLVSSLFAWLEVAAALAVVRPNYYMEDMPERLFRPDRIAARAQLGLELEF